MVTDSSPPGPAFFLRRCFFQTASMSTYLRLGSTISVVIFFWIWDCSRGGTMGWQLDAVYDFHQRSDSSALDDGYKPYQC